MTSDIERMEHIKQEIFESIKPQSEERGKEIDRALSGFALPIRLDNHNEYKPIISNILNAYVDSIGNTPSLKSVPNLLQDTQEIVKAILDAFDFAREGQTNDALKLIKSIILKYIDDAFFVSELDSSYAFRASAVIDEFKHKQRKYDKQKNYPLSFYRCRKGEIKSQQDMLHIPWSKRSQVPSGRFSIPEIPCLYLSTTSFCCYKELGDPDNMSVISLSANNEGKKIKVLNLVITQRLINGVACNPYENPTELEIKMRKFFPFVIATSASTENKDSHENTSEYIVSNLLIKCLKDLGIDGIAYSSTRIDDEFQFPYGVNLAIPIYQPLDNQEFGEICRGFDITNPFYFDLSGTPLKYDKSHCRSYLNTIFHEEILSTIELEGKRVQYSQSKFGKIDDMLVGKEHSPVIKI